MADLSIQHLRKTFGPVEVLKDINLEIADREFVCFLGPSGCGKSTLLRCIAGLEEVQGGELRIAGRRINELPPAERDLAMVFQSYALYPHMSVRKNLAFGLSLRGRPKGEIEARIQEAARMLQLEELLERKPRQLSGGQRQRVAIGRAIVRQPRIFLFDEPLSNLDAALRENTRMELARLHQSLQATMIYVTHDQIEAMTLASKVVVLNQGRIAQVGKPLELYHAPADLFVAGFIGSPRMNLLPAEVLGAIAARPGAMTLGIRPEHLRLGDAGSGGGLRAQVQMVECLGAQSLVHLRLADGHAMTASVEGARAVQIGDQLGLTVAAEHVHAFGTDGRALPRVPSEAVQDALALA
ncbi:ABC transporter ATP-binding protein [Roseateles cavernae]|uniref:ABC transporter ATP-binding protein n=1 Tax=Roseateles cavernae TaxID=3153578 RepID=UPI0032E4862F